MPGPYDSRGKKVNEVKRYDVFGSHTGYRSSKYPRRYGVELALELIDGFDGEGLHDNEREAALADWLRAQGCAVWQN
jgi:hypothetical protein